MLSINTSTIINYLEAWANETISSRAEAGSGQVYQEIVKNYNSLLTIKEQVIVDLTLASINFALGVIVIHVVKYVVMRCYCRHTAY